MSRNTITPKQPITNHPFDEEQSVRLCTDLFWSANDKELTITRIEDY